MTRLRETSKKSTVHALKPLQNAQLRSKIKIPKEQAKLRMFFAKKKQKQKTANIKKNQIILKQVKMGHNAWARVFAKSSL